MLFSLALGRIRTEVGRGVVITGKTSPSPRPGGKETGSYRGSHTAIRGSTTHIQCRASVTGKNSSVDLISAGRPQEKLVLHKMSVSPLIAMPSSYSSWSSVTLVGTLRDRPSLRLSPFGILLQCLLSFLMRSVQYILFSIIILFRLIIIYVTLNLLHQEANFHTGFHLSLAFKSLNIRSIF
jgi:hypothetical protein